MAVRIFPKLREPGECIVATLVPESWIEIGSLIRKVLKMQDIEIKLPENQIPKLVLSMLKIASDQPTYLKKEALKTAA